MRKFLILLLFIGMGKAYAMSNDTTQNAVKDSANAKRWTYKGQYGFIANQIAFSNWAAGGESSLSGRTTLDYELKYHKGKFAFTHSGHFAFGLVGYKSKKIQKTDDRIDVLFTLGHKISKHWDFTGLASFKSQFANGYKYPDDSTLISGFMAPGYLTISLGFNYKPHKNFQLFLSPLSGKVTFVLNQTLADKGAFGVKKAVFDSTGNLIVHGDNYLGQLGINIVSSYQAKIMKNILFQTRINLYNNYLEPIPGKRWQIDMDWDNQVNFKINEYFATVLYLHMKYDPNALIPKYQNINGEQTMISESARLQLKESLGVGFTYKIK